MKDKIAIIGLSCLLPSVRSYADLVRAVRNGDPLIRNLSEARLDDIRKRFGTVEFMDGGYLDRIDLFDNEYFGIVQQESLRMDPDQRLMLEQAVQAIYNAGYNEKYIRENNVGFFTTHEGSNYAAFFDEPSHLALTAHMPGMAATRVANFLDIRGPVVGFHTSCSTSLTAFHHACTSLKNLECTIALVGGVKLNLLRRDEAHDSPIISKSNRCLPFDEEADGTLVGEGALCMVLKRLEDAERDGDFIYAVVSGSAMNHGGSRLSNLTAPSEEAQADVLVSAWDNAKIDPADIGFIEAHGTGTLLGDPIEYAGITNAFHKKNVSGNRCIISSIKGQVGHLDTLSGLAGVFRAVVAVREKLLPGQVGFNKANTFLKQNDDVQIQRETQPWNVPENKLRTAGVSSFGMTGTNVHVVIQEFKSDVAPSPEVIPARFLLNIACRSGSEWQKNSAYLAGYLEHHKTDLKDFCAYVSRIFSHGEYRRSIHFKTRLELIAGLKNPSGEKAGIQTTFYIIFAAITTFSRSDITALLRSSQKLSGIWRNFFASSGASEDDLDTTTYNVLFLYLLITYIKGSSSYPLNLIFLQEGAVVEKLYNQSLTIQGLVANPHQVSPKSFNEEKFKSFVDSLDEDKGHRVVLADKQGGKADRIFSEAGKKAVRLSDDPGQFLMVQSLLFRAGCIADFQAERMSAPLGVILPALEPKRFWPDSRLLNQHVATAPAEQLAPVSKTEDIPAALKEIWKEKIGLNGRTIGDGDDFFEIGGNSLIGLDVLGAIERQMNVTLEYQDIFEYPTIELLANRIEKLTRNVATASPGGMDQQPARSSRTGVETDYSELLNKIGQIDHRETIEPDRILVTGATGFLGAFVVEELLKKTTAMIYCVVRASTDAEATERLVKTYEHYFPAQKHWVNDRIMAVRGDVGEENFGLAGGKKALPDNIGAVYHLAANVSHYGKFSVSDKINHGGTRRVLEWAKESGVQHFNHFSTLAVIGTHIPGIGHLDFYESDLDAGQEFGHQVYGKSKFLAEQCIIQNKSDNLRYNIFRTGNVSGASQSGVFQTNMDKNNIYLAFRTISKLGIFPEEFLSQQIEMSPVDAIASSIVNLSLAKNNPLKTYHIYNTAPYTFAEVIEAMGREGIKIKIIPLAEVQNSINQIHDFADVVSLGIARYTSGNASQASTVFHIRNEATLLCMQKTDSEIIYDRNEYIRSVIKYCLEAGFILNE